MTTSPRNFSNQQVFVLERRKPRRDASGGDSSGSGKEEMGATTNPSSSSSSTARPCCAVVPRRAHGGALLELLSLRASGRGARRPPYGTVRVYDGRRGQIVYTPGRDHQAAPSRRSSRRARNQGWIVLPLTGPHRAISAEGRVSMALDLHDDAHPPRQEAAVVLWDAYSPDLLYDKPIKRAVDTLVGSAEVTYVVRSNAVQGAVQVRLRRESWHRRPGAAVTGCLVKGKIAARATTASSAEAAAVVVLFDGEGECTTAAQETAAVVPLARSIVAAPVKHPLVIDVDLRAQSGEEIVKGSLKFFPKLDEEQQVERLVGADGVVAEVKVSWSD